MPVPQGLTPDTLKRLAAMHQQNKARFMRETRKATGMSAIEAKRLALHISLNSRCHWCNDPLVTSAIAVCGSICGAVNIDLKLLADSSET